MAPLVTRHPALVGDACGYAFGHAVHEFGTECLVSRIPAELQHGDQLLDGLRILSFHPLFQVGPQMLNRVEVGRVGRPLETIDSRLFQPSLHQFAAVFGVIILLKPPLALGPESTSGLQKMFLQDVFHQAFLEILDENVTFAHSSC
jgi:hypothetical protein